MTLELVEEGLRARLELQGHYVHGFDDLVDFFAGMASHWRGWQGELAYESLEHDLEIVASHDGRVMLDIQLRSIVGRRWSARSMLSVEPGEEMSRFAEALAVLLARR